MEAYSSYSFMCAAQYTKLNLKKVLHERKYDYLQPISISGIPDATLSA
jgi:hypothetical protein